MILSAAILLSILLPIILSIVISLPTVQNRLVHQATRYASEFLGTKVDIARIDISPRGGLEVYDFLVCDLQQDTMIYVKRLESNMSSLPLLGRRVALGNTTIEGGEVNLLSRIGENGDVEMNIRQVTQLLASKDRSKQPVTVDVSNVVIEDFTVRIKQLQPQNPLYGVDMRDIELRNISSSISNLLVDGPMLHTHINRFSGVEKSGFEMDDIAGELYLSEGALSLLNLRLYSRWSSLDIDHLMLSNRSWRNYRDFNTTTRVDLAVTGGSVSSDDLAYFAPSLRNCGVELRDIELLASGEVSDLDLSITNLSYGDGTRLNADIGIVGLPDVKGASFDIKLGEFITSALDLDQLKWSFSGSGFDELTHSRIDALGRVELIGGVKGTMSSFSVEGEMFSGAGDVETDLSVVMDGDTSLSLDGVVALRDFDMSHILAGSGLGVVTMGLNVDGVVDGVESDLLLSSDLESVAWRDWTIQDISVGARICNGGFSDVEILCGDPYLNLDLRGNALNLYNGAVPNYSMELNLHNLDLAGLGINRRDKISALSGDVVILGEGHDLEECWGDIIFRNGLYKYNQERLDLEELDLSIHSQEGDRYAVLESDYARAEFKSVSSVSHIMNYLRGAVVRYLPALYDDAESIRASMYSVVEPDAPLDMLDCSQLSVELYDVSPITQAMGVDIKVGSGSNLIYLFDTYSDNFEATIESPYLEQGTTMAIDFRGAIEGRGDSMVMSSSIKELLIGTSFIEHSMFGATVHNDNIEMQAQFINSIDSAYVDIGANVAVRRDGAGSREVDIKLLPSTINRREEVWDMRANAIQVNSQGFDIDDFKLSSRNQMMIINGRASSHATDTMRMEMRNFDLSIFSTLIAQLGYQIDGRTNGEAFVSSVLHERSIEALVELDSVRVNTLVAPPMLLRAEWDSQRNRARLHLSDRTTCDTLIRGYYIPSEVKYYAQLDVDSLKMAMLDPPLGGVITNTEGFAKLSLLLQGARRNAHLNGSITVYDMSTTVDYTKVRYNIPKATINVSDNMLSGESIRVNDGMGGSGVMSLDVDLQHLSNIGYKLNLAPRKMMVLDTKEVDNDTFYGEIFASGVVGIEGDRSGVKMNITASTDDNSKFFMPLASKSNISSVDFITFVQPSVIDTTSLIQMRRMQLESRNKDRGAGSMEINMDLDVRSNAEMQLVIDPTVGDIIRARGEGKINLRIEPKSNIFNMYGDYTIEEGNYLFTLRNIVNKRFVIDPGSSIQWSGSPMDPILDINAIYQLKTSLQPLISDESTRTVPVDCVINLSDRLTQPDVSFAIELPTADPEQQSVVSSLLNDQESISRQFFYLMLANAFIPESTATGSSDLGISTTTATGFELLTNQLSNWLSSSNYNVIIRYRPESELAGDEVDFGFSRGLVNNRLLVELEGNYIIDNKQALTEESSNFLGEAYVTWLIDRAGALRLKGFTQTIDRYDENQGLQETGVGIYYRENFNNFRDLQQRVKARFSASDERLEKREERRSKRQDKKREGEVVLEAIVDEDQIEE